MRYKKFWIHAFNIEAWNISSIGRIMVLVNKRGNLHLIAKMRQTKFESFIANILLNSGWLANKTSCITLYGWHQLQKLHDEALLLLVCGTSYKEGGVTKELQQFAVISSNYIFSWSFLITLLFWIPWILRMFNWRVFMESQDPELELELLLS
jgi:hypothetical protein